MEVDVVMEGPALMRNGLAVRRAKFSRAYEDLRAVHVLVPEPQRASGLPSDVFDLTAAEWRTPEGTILPPETVMQGIRGYLPS